MLYASFIMAIYRTTDSGQSDRDTHLDNLLIEKIRCIIFYKPVHLILFPLLILQLTVLDPDSSERFLFFIKGERQVNPPANEKSHPFG